MASLLRLREERLLTLASSEARILGSQNSASIDRGGGGGDGENAAPEKQGGRVEESENSSSSEEDD